MRFLFLDKEMPKKLYYDEEQRKTAIKEHKKKYYKHKELYKLISLRAYYRRKLTNDNSNRIHSKINELNTMIEYLHENNTSINS